MVCNYNIINFILQELNNEFHDINNVSNEELNVNTNVPCRASEEFIDSLQEIEITEEGKTCYICLEECPDIDGKPLVRDCSCRGSDSGFAHISCIGELYIIFFVNCCGALL